MSILARSTLRAARTFKATQQVRFAHIENVVNHTLPTKVTNKPFLAFQIIVFAASGFGIPFIGAYYQLTKNA